MVDWWTKPYVAFGFLYGAEQWNKEIAARVALENYRENLQVQSTIVI